MGAGVGEGEDNRGGRVLWCGRRFSESKENSVHMSDEEVAGI